MRHNGWLCEWLGCFINAESRFYLAGITWPLIALRIPRDWEERVAQWQTRWREFPWGLGACSGSGRSGGLAEALRCREARSLPAHAAPRWQRNNWIRADMAVSGSAVERSYQTRSCTPWNTGSVEFWGPFQPWASEIPLSAFWVQCAALDTEEKTKNEENTAPTIMEYI